MESKENLSPKEKSNKEKSNKENLNKDNLNKDNLNKDNLNKQKLNKQKTPKISFLKNKSLLTKLIFAFIIAISFVFILNIFLFNRISKTINKMEQAYQSNITISEMQDTLSSIQNNLYSYLNGNHDALKDYYVEYNNLQTQMNVLNNTPSDNEIKLLEKNIFNLSSSYLALTETAVLGHRGTDIELYTSSYEKATQIHNYLEDSLYVLSNDVFIINTDKYMQLSKVQNYTQIMNLALLLLGSIVEIIIVVSITNQLFRPLSDLAKQSELIGKGNLDVPPLEIRNNDEIGQVTDAFNQMISKLRKSIHLWQEQLEEENKLKQKQLQLETYYKDSQLKALQSQINPHFLYNTLNAGMQLALMEDAENTSVFLEHTSDYFRYNLKRSGKDVTLNEELTQIDNYIFIMNTRYAGAINYEKHFPSRIPYVRLPGMILQPLVENAIEHGFHMLETGKRLIITVSSNTENIILSIANNGETFPQEKIDDILYNTNKEIEFSETHNGIGLANVISRLRLYYGKENIIEILPFSEETGTEIKIYLPITDNADINL